MICLHLSSSTDQRGGRRKRSWNGDSRSGSANRKWGVIFLSFCLPFMFLMSNSGCGIVITIPPPPLSIQSQKPISTYDANLATSHAWLHTQSQTMASPQGSAGFLGCGKKNSSLFSSSAPSWLVVKMVLTCEKQCFSVQKVSLFWKPDLDLRRTSRVVSSMIWWAVTTRGLLQ